MATAAIIQEELHLASSKEKSISLQRFFKTGPGQYGFGDKFIGVMVPAQRAIVKKYFRDTSLAEIQKLVQSKIHEERLTGLIILVEQYKIADEKNQKQIFNFYVKNFRYVNNWDLVDVTCRDVIGAYLFDKPKTLLYKLVQSKNLWYRRIAIISTFYFIQRKQYADSLKIAKLLLNDREDLIHKAVGWMLREIGKRSPAVEEKFLRKYASKMPRTMLRYAIEKFSPEIRRYYLSLS